MKKLILCMMSFCVGTVAVAADYGTASVGEVAVMASRNDGKYDVYCTNGNREVVNDLDLSLNNVCPNRTASEPTNIISLQKRDDGKYDIVCKDLRKLVISQDELLKGGACAPSVPKKMLEDGHYKVISGNTSYYDHDTNSTMEGNALKEVNVSISSGWKCAFSCVGTACRGVKGASTCPEYKLDVLSPKQYRFTGTSGVAVFERQ